MDKPSEYLAAAAVMALRGEKAGDVPTDRADLRMLMEQVYGIGLDESRMNLLLGQLGAWKMVEVTSDPFAGELLRLSRARSDAAWEEAKSEVLDRSWEWRDALFGKVFANEEFWRNLDAQQELRGDETVQASGDYAPASDRVVTLAHNQFNAIAGPADEIIANLEADNGLPDEPAWRERVLGQLKAGRELLRAGVFELSLFRMSMVAGLILLADRYADKAVGVAASVLLTVILHELGLPGF